jgi:hypothetical protein
MDALGYLTVGIAAGAMIMRIALLLPAALKGQDAGA